jgi:hypothetical protein
MSTPDQNHPQSSEEQQFIQKAMADVDRAEKLQKIKQVAVLALLLGALLWLAVRAPGPGINNAFVCLILAICTAKILFRIDSSTRTIVRAIANRR